MSERMTDAELAELRELADKATPEPWTANSGTRSGHYEIWSGPEGHDNWLATTRWGTEPVREAANAEFIARSREAVPRLLDEIERLRRERERLVARIIEVDGGLHDLKEMADASE